jgi:serine/threonine-protein kinase
MAEVYRGFTFSDDGIRYDVAIKKLLPAYVEDGQFVTMLTDEYRLVSRMNHGNVARVYELVQVQGSILVAMEYVDGKDLRATVEKGRDANDRLGYADVAYVMACALDGLHHAHQAVDERGDRLDVVHRDFSPSNVLVGYDGAVKLIDFGIAKARQNRIQTKTGIIKGKVKYMSPEQAFGRKLDWRSDVFSAGSVLYELVTGQSAFTAPNEVDLIFAVRDASPVPAREISPEVPGELAGILEKAMTRSRSARYQSALEFRNALLTFLRAYNPSYRRNKLAQFLKRVFAEDIERELRAMEDYVAEATPEQKLDLGRNLIASALGPDAPFSRFHPNPTRTGSRPEEPPAAETTHRGDRRGRHTQKSEIDPNDPIHHEKTQVGRRPPAT